MDRACGGPPPRGSTAARGLRRLAAGGRIITSVVTASTTPAKTAITMIVSAIDWPSVIAPFLRREIRRAGAGPATVLVRFVGSPTPVRRRRNGRVLAGYGGTVDGLGSSDGGGPTGEVAPVAPVGPVMPALSAAWEGFGVKSGCGNSGK